MVLVTGIWARRGASLVAIGILALEACAAPRESLHSRSAPSIAPEEIRAHLRFLADDLLEGRDTGTRGHLLAARYVAAQFEAMGLEPAGDDGTYFQNVPLRRATLVAGESSLVVVRSGEPSAAIGDRPLRFGDDFLLSPPFEANDREVTGPLVFTGFGISAPELDHDDFAELEVEGAIVVHLSGAPERFGSTERAFYSSLETKAQQALDRGAVGLLTVSTPLDERRRPWEGMRERAGSPRMRWIDRETGTPSGAIARLGVVGSLSRPAAETLLRETPHSLEAVFESAESAEPLRFSMGSRAKIRVVGRQEDFESPNVAARLAGSSLAEETVVYTSHLDHVGRGPVEDGDDIYNGALDNASGVAVMLTVARAFAETRPPPSRSVLFLAVTAEEKGLLGSDYFAHHPTVPAESIVANVNADGVLMLYPLLDVIAFGAQHSTILDPVSRAADELGIALSPDFMPEEVIFIRSDQYSFVRQGIPSVYPFVGTDTGSDRVDGERAIRDWMATTYHRPSDDMSQELDFDAGADYARLAYRIGWFIATDPERPRWNEGDFLGAKFAPE